MNTIQYVKKLIKKNGLSKSIDVVHISKEYEDSVILLTLDPAEEILKKLPENENYSLFLYSYYQLGISFKNLKKENNSKKQIKKDVPTRPKKKRGKKAKPLNLTKDQENKIKKMFENGKRISAISRAVNMTYYNVTKFLKQEGLK